jgi:hypothetical protein
MAKRQRRISRIFHPVDKDERLFNVASDIEVLNTQLERDS